VSNMCLLNTLISTLDAPAPGEGWIQKNTWLTFLFEDSRVLYILKDNYTCARVLGGVCVCVCVCASRIFYSTKHFNNIFIQLTHYFEDCRFAA
jgi:hypothetical protein